MYILIAITFVFVYIQCRQNVRDNETYISGLEAEVRVRKRFENMDCLVRNESSPSEPHNEVKILTFLLKTFLISYFLFQIPISKYLIVSNFQFL